MAAIEGRAWVFGDDVSTDYLAPGRFMKGGIEEIAAHCMEIVDPEFAGRVAAGDVVVAGNNFGMGSSREQAVQALLHLGVGAVIARSFARIFYRNGFNLGMRLLTCPAADRIAPGDFVRVDAAAGTVVDLTNGEQLEAEPIPPHLMAMIADGGLLPHLEKKLRGEAS